MRTNCKWQITNMLAGTNVCMKNPWKRSKVKSCKLTEDVPNWLCQHRSDEKRDVFSIFSCDNYLPDFYRHIERWLVS